MALQPRPVRLGLAAHGNVYTAAYIALQEGFFARHGLEVHLTYHGVLEVVDALDVETIDIGLTAFPDNAARWVTSPKTTAIIIATGNTRAVNEKWVLNSIMTTGDYLGSHRAEVLDFMRAMLESVHFMWTEQEKAAQYVVQDQGETRGIGISQFSSVTSPLMLYRQVLGKIPKTMEITEAYIRNALSFLAMVRHEVAGADPALFYDGSILEDLRRDGFIDTLWSQT